MAVVVEQTIPFSTSDLDVENSSRWTTLLPLIRPSVKAISVKDQTILVDLSAASKEEVCVAAVGRLGNFSSKLLECRHVCAVAPESVSAHDVVHALKEDGSENCQGLVLVRSGKHRKLVLDSKVVEVEVAGDLELDHVLHLLGSSTQDTRASLEKTAEMLKHFLKTADTAHSNFHVEKLEANPSILHGDGTSHGFEQAKHAVERDLQHVLKSHIVQYEPVTYSVHYSDVNGLSRLENYILGRELGEYFDSQGLPYALSTSTVLRHDDLTRGFSISISPVPQHYLQPQPKMENPLADEQGQTATLTRVDSRYMRFSDAQVRACVEKGCNAVIAEEATITRYDEIVGDGDCGYTLRDGAKQVLQFVSDKDLGDLPQTLGELVHDLEVNMGGTSGALYCIFLTALSATLAETETVAGAVQDALAELLKYTKAREGDRTMMDCLIPFADVFSKTGDLGKALEEARKGVESTKDLEAKLGRSTYLDEGATKGVPDPGAYGLLVLLEGMCQV